MVSLPYVNIKFDNLLLKGSLPIEIPVEFNLVLANASLFNMGASSTTVALPSCITLLSAVPFLILHMGMSIVYKSNGILKVLCNVRPPVKNVTAIPLDAVANAILPSE